MPAATVKPTHTGMGVGVHYPEPNPHVDPGEAATIPGYTWYVLECHPVFFGWNSVVNQVWPDIVAFHDYDTDICYWVPGPDHPSGKPDGHPTPPTPIFDQVWVMPASTVAPNHVGGTVHYPEPNPSPSGTEPATIPGYVWRYVSSETPAQWTSTGELFIDSAQISTPTAFTLADGTSTAVGDRLGAGGAAGRQGRDFYSELP